MLPVDHPGVPSARAPDQWSTWSERRAPMTDDQDVALDDQRTTGCCTSGPAAPCSTTSRTKPRPGPASGPRVLRPRRAAARRSSSRPTAAFADPSPTATRRTRSGPQLLLDRIDLVLARWQVLLDRTRPRPLDGSAPPKRVLRVTGELPDWSSRPCRRCSRRAVRSSQPDARGLLARVGAQAGRRALSAPASGILAGSGRRPRSVDQRLADLPVPVARGDVCSPSSPSAAAECSPDTGRPTPARRRCRSRSRPGSSRSGSSCCAGAARAPGRPADARAPVRSRCAPRCRWRGRRGCLRRG